MLCQGSGNRLTYRWRSKDISVEELLGFGEVLNLKAMNGTDRHSFFHWIEVRFKLVGDDTTADELTDQEYRSPALMLRRKFSVNAFKIPKLQVAAVIPLVPILT